MRGPLEVAVLYKDGETVILNVLSWEVGENGTLSLREDADTYHTLAHGTWAEVSVRRSEGL